MRVLHTADWHLGRALYGRKRDQEFKAFLDWLVAIIHREKIDVLLIAGDVFDTSAPSNRAQSLYYKFLCQIANDSCRHVVVIAGNHDSPTFLEAPKELLKTLNVHVVGAVSDDLHDEVITLWNEDKPEAIICAVPYLRDKDIRQLEAGENIDDKNLKLLEGVKSHYHEVCQIAEQQQLAWISEGLPKVPIIGMGHLFAAGGQTMDDDGVRELYVGSLAHVSGDVFPKSLDYLALGHLHVPQVVGGMAHIRYSGSPIPMGFGEANQKKQLLMIEFRNDTMMIESLPIPTFQVLRRITGDFEKIQHDIAQLIAKNSDAWLEIEYTGQAMISDLRGQLDDQIEGSLLEILRIKNKWVMNQLLKAEYLNETLDDITPMDVFERCLDASHVTDEDRLLLQSAYAEVLQDIYYDDDNAE